MSCWLVASFLCGAIACSLATDARMDMREHVCGFMSSMRLLQRACCLRTRQHMNAVLNAFFAPEQEVGTMKQTNFVLPSRHAQKQVQTQMQMQMHPETGYT